MAEPELFTRKEIQDTAAVVEAERVERADEVEVNRLDREDEAEVTRKELAKILEEDRKRHNIRLEQRLRERTRQVNRRFLVLFLAMAAVFGLLAYRSQVNDQDTETNTHLIEQGLFDACQARADTATQYNQGREALIQLAINTPREPPYSQDQRDVVVAQLRAGLLLPIETCGQSPS